MKNLKKQKYKYKVAETKVVYPNQVEVTQKTPTEQVSLMTCVPVGTSLKRLIIIAKPE